MYGRKVNPKQSYFITLTSWPNLFVNKPWFKNKHSNVTRIVDSLGSYAIEQKLFLETNIIRWTFVELLVCCIW